MKNIWLIALISMMLGISSCSKDDDKEMTFYTVTFDTEGGSPIPATQKVEIGNIASPPSVNPTKSGYTFMYWCLNGASVAYNFQTPVTGDITLCAKWKKDEVTETTTFTIRNTNDWKNAINAIHSGGSKSYTLNIEGIVSVPPTTEVNAGDLSTYTFGGGKNLSITLTGNGTLALADKGFLICAGGKTGAKPKIVIDGPTLQGRSDNVVPLLRLDYADLELKNGKIIKNTNNGGGGSGDGGGAHIKHGVFTMSGGEISDNISGQNGYVSDGGGVSINGAFNLSGGVISGNTGSRGGGVYIEGRCTMTGGIIKANTAKSSSPYGGGIYLRGNGPFIKTGGIIYGYSTNDSNSNITRNYTNIVSKYGAAIFCPMDNVIGNSDDKYRDSTLEESDQITTEESAGWED